MNFHKYLNSLPVELNVIARPQAVAIAMSESIVGHHPPKLWCVTVKQRRALIPRDCHAPFGDSQ